MIPNSFSALCHTLTPKLADHLWQSTLFAVAAAGLALLFRRNHPRVRYWLWFAASMKFLLPFSLLVALGSSLAGSAGPARPKTDLYFYGTVEEALGPFTRLSQPTVSGLSNATRASGAASWTHLIPEFLIVGWLCGTVLVFAAWFVRWRRVRATRHASVPMRAGREIEALRRVESEIGSPQQTEMLLSPSFEPGVFGVGRPVLLWPKGISERLSDAQLDAILAHELRHIRRRDNLVGAIHMFVETIFWFHPLVWWLGTRLVEEREQACDEDVLELGTEREVYAESILKVCEFCIASPLPSVAGVTGSDLKKRMVNIMSERSFAKLDFGKKLVLGVAAIMAVAAPIFLGLLNPPSIRAQSEAGSSGANLPALENVTVKPSALGNTFQTVQMGYSPAGLVANNVTLEMLIRDAYGVQESQVSGGPSWLNSARFDVQAKFSPPASGEPQDLDPEKKMTEHQLLLQALLADRFKLALHRETKELPVYVLVVAGNGPKLQEVKSSDGSPNNMNVEEHVGGGRMMMGRGTMQGEGVPFSGIVRMLSEQLEHPVIDKTGLNGKYNFTLQWTHDASKDSNDGNLSSQPSRDAPSVLAAVEQQLGLKLELQKGPVETVVIDHAEEPTEN